MSKYIIFSGFLMVFCCFDMIQAQEVEAENTASIQVRGSVINTVEMEELTSELIQNPVFIPDSPEQQTIVIDPVTSVGVAGYMIVRGSAGYSFNFQVPKTMRLINGDDGSSFEITISLSYNSAEDQASSTLLREQMADLTLNDSGQLYFWIGGIMDLSALSSGEYTGELIFEISYI
jgi:hypothetical protein